MGRSPFNSSLWLSALISIQLIGHFLAVNSTPTSAGINCQIAIDFHGANAAYASLQFGPKTLTSVTLLLVYHKHPSTQAQTIHCSLHCLLRWSFQGSFFPKNFAFRCFFPGRKTYCPLLIFHRFHYFYPTKITQLASLYHAQCARYSIMFAKHHTSNFHWNALYCFARAQEEPSVKQMHQKLSSVTLVKNLHDQSHVSFVISTNPHNWASIQDQTNNFRVRARSCKTLYQMLY